MSFPPSSSCRVTKTRVTEAGDNPMSGIPRMSLGLEDRVPEMGGDGAGHLVETPLGGLLVHDPSGLDPVEAEGAATVAQPAPGHEVPLAAPAHEPVRLDLAGLGGAAGAVDVAELEDPVAGHGFLDRFQHRRPGQLSPFPHQVDARDEV